MDEKTLEQFEEEAELYARKAVNEFMTTWYENDANATPIVLPVDNTPVQGNTNGASN